MFSNLKSKLIAYCESIKFLNWIVKLNRKLYSWIDSSILNHFIFFFSIGTFGLLFRGVGFWLYGGQDVYWTVFWISAFMVYFFVLFSTFLKYLYSKGWFQNERKVVNKKKWSEFKGYVSQKHNLKWNIYFNDCFLFIIIPHTIFLFCRDVYQLQGSFWSIFGMVFFSCILGLYFINHVYIKYWLSKTEMPADLLLEPSKFYSRIVTRIISYPPIHKRMERKYGFGKKSHYVRILYNKHTKEFWGLTIGVGTLLWWVNGTDQSAAEWGQRPSYGGQISMLANFGWTTSDNKTRAYAFRMHDWGIDVKQYCQPGSSQLDSVAVKEAYMVECEKRFKNPMKIRLESVDAELGVVKGELDSVIEVAKMWENEARALADTVAVYENKVAVYENKVDTLTSEIDFYKEKSDLMEMELKRLAEESKKLNEILAQVSERNLKKTDKELSDIT